MKNIVNSPKQNVLSEIKLIFGTFNCHSSKSPFVLIHRRNLYQKKKTMKSTEHPAPMATQDVAFRDVASLRN